MRRVLSRLEAARRREIAVIELERLDAMLSRGEEVDMRAYAQVSGHLRRMWETLGIERRAKDVTTPSVEDYLKHKNTENEVKNFAA